ncbi:hypothetical protein CTI14_00665 [Methylobacterium radiotolerans]|nr:hypothetical protein CTI14_00665 [Methylobacterium radiotolerans]
MAEKGIDEVLPLVQFQQQAVDGLQAVARQIVEYHQRNPTQRRQIALSSVSLLQSPTGSGKTLILGRTLQGLKGKLGSKCVWFWFAPYTGLVAQTREALAKQCSSLRLRDVYSDRSVEIARDGDVYVQTWASVSSQQKEARTVRRTTESTMSLDDMVATLRADGFLIGVVIDEAHVNFGATANVAARFYLDVLQPDLTILATATPNDDKLKEFSSKAGIEVSTRIVIDRQQVVHENLNKAGLMLGVLRFQEEDAPLIDLEQATLTAAWFQHEQVKKHLASEGVGVTPLMLVQVEDQPAGGEDPVARVRQKLEQIGVSSTTIRSHTSGEPDPEFHSLAYDPAVEVLIFKVAVATGFDAPRAWTLVSVRPNRGREFGLQIVGRIMRVHPSVRARPEKDTLLDRGYVFLTDPELQSGLSTAVEELKAVQQGIELLTDKLDVIEFGNMPIPLMAGAAHSMSALPSPPMSVAEREHRLMQLIRTGAVNSSIADLSPAEIDRAIVLGEALADLGKTPLFGALPMQATPQQQASDAGRKSASTRAYALRTDLGIPQALIREELPDIHQIAEDLTAEIAGEFCKLVELRGELNRRKRRATVNFRELFDGAEENKAITVRVSEAKIAERAQFAFQFNDSLDPRHIKRALVAEFQNICEHEGIEYKIEDLRRAIEVSVLRHPEKLRVAVRNALRRHLLLLQDQDIPQQEYWPEGLPKAIKGAYGVLPPTMNGEERAFAEFLDNDRTGTVKWWLRNPENSRWSTRLVLPNGRRFFPDFVVGVTNRSTPNSIALVEIKDDGIDGRLHASNNVIKIRVQHQEYRNVFWSYRWDGTWTKALYDEGLHRIVPSGAFSIADMVYLT